jgi:RHS repeat-associated protein
MRIGTYNILEEDGKVRINKMIKRLIAYAIVFVFMFQCTLGVYAENMDKNQMSDKAAKEIKKELKLAAVKTEKPHKLPPGLMKKEDAFEKWKGKKEKVEDRTENSKTYVNEDGTLTSVVFMQPIHIKDHKGKLIDIDNTLVPLKEGNKYSHKNKIGHFDVFFSGESSENGSIKVEKNNITIEMTSLDATTKDMIVEENSVVYKGSKKGVEHLYAVGFNGIKEDIILNQSIDEPIFSYELDVKGPADVVQEEDLIYVVDKKTNTTVFTLSAPFMKDDDGNQSFDVDLQLSKANGKNKITVTADEQWLKDPARVYPVKIDPSVSVTNFESTADGEDSKEVGAVADTFTQHYKNYLTHNTENYIYVGYDDGRQSTNGKYAKFLTRGYIKFNIPDVVKQSPSITSAYLNLYQYTGWGNNNRLVDIWELPSGTSINSLTEINQPKPGTPVMSVSVSASEKRHEWDFLQLVNKWAKGSNNGIGMKMRDESAQAECFYSSNYSKDSDVPRLEITFTTKPSTPPEAGDLELVLERSDKMENGTAYAKGTLTTDLPESGENKITISYKLMPDGTSGEIVEENLSTLDWETEKFNLEVDKAYWIEANIKVEDWIVPESADPEIPPPPPYYEEVLNENKKTSKFVVGEAQPGDTLKRLAKHYLLDGSKYTEVKELNKLTEEALTVGQKLFVLTDKNAALSYKQPLVITPEIELKDMTSGSDPVNTELVGQFINPHNGNFAYSNVDFAYSTYNLDIAMIRSHNSILENRKSPLGDKWDYSFNKFLFFQQDGTIGYNTGDGSRVYFRNTGGVYRTAAPVYDVITDKDTYYELKKADNTSYQFSKTGLLTKIVDKNNNETIVEYNENDWQTTITDSASRAISLDYIDTGSALTGNISSITMPDGSTVDYTYNAEANTLEIYSDPDGYTNIYSYDSSKRMETLISGRDITSITNHYDGSGRVFNQYDGKTVLVNLSYSSGITTFTDGKSHPYKYSYNSKLWLTNKEFPDNISESYIHNVKGDITKRTDRLNKQHQYDYNGLGFVTKYTRPDLKFMQYDYKNDYLLEYIRDFEGQVTNLDYDSNNNLDKETRSVTDNGRRIDVITNYSFTPEGLISSVTDPDGVTTTFDNSGYPNEQKVTEEGNDPYQYYFDTMGRLITAIDPKGYETRTTYDNRGNATFVSYPSTEEIDRYSSYFYDGNSNLAFETGSRLVPDGSGYPTTIYGYDNNNNLVTVLDSYGYTTTYEYDKNNNLDWEKDQEQNMTDYGYDQLNRLKTIKYPNQTSPAFTYDYDDLGNTEKVTEADGDWTAYTYDYAVNRIKTISKPEGYNVVYDYDDMGNIETETLPDDNTIDYVYDELYRVKTITEPGNKITKIDYKNSGRVKKIDDYTDKTFTYEYYADGQLERTEETYTDPLTSETIKYEMVYTYDDNGNMQTITDENDHKTTYYYNELNKVSKEIDPLFKTKEYSYDEDGNVSTTIDGEKNVTKMEYDALNRLYSVRILSEEAGAAARSFNTMSTTSTTEEDTVYTYLYNSRGMLEYYIDPMENKTTYSYNPLGKLEKVTNAKLEEIKYKYYNDGTLQKVTYPNQQYEEYEYDGQNRPVWSKDRSGVEQTILYTVTGQPDLITDDVGNEIDYQYDELGRVRTIQDKLNRTETYTYDSAGNVQAIKGMDNTTTKYTYDPRGRIRMVLDTEDKATIMEYNGQNQVVQMEKPGNRVYTYDYDNSGNLWRVIDPAQNKTEYLYNNNNQVEEIIDARNNSKKYEYNTLNKLEKVVNERNYPTTYKYYPGGQLKTVKDSKGFETNYQYDKLNRISVIENPLKETITYDYDSMGNVESIEDARGVKTTYIYNARDQVEKTFDTQGHQTTRLYYPNGDLRTHLDEENRATSYQYDEVHRLTKLLESGGYEKNYVYNPISGDIDRMFDNAGKFTVYSYDDAHRLMSEKNEQGHLTEYTYDDFGNIETKKTPDGNVVTYGYDILDRVSSILDPENKLTEINYDPMGNIDYVIKPENQKYAYSYDPANNIEKIIDPMGQETVYTYDPNNNIATMLDPSGNLFNYNFDALNRLESVIDTTNSGSKYHYDASGNLDIFTDGNNNKTYYGYDNLNRLEWVKDGEGNTTSYTYFNDGKLKSMTDANGQTSNYTYDAAGNLASFKNPLGETKSFQYTLLNQIKNITNPDGKQINYAYDEFNRLGVISYAGGDTVEYAYDDLNRKIGMADKNGVSEYEYDDMGRLTWVSDAAGEEVSYEYDEKGRKSKLIYPDGKFVTYAYDEHDRLETVRDRESRVTSYTYDDAGRLKTTKYPNGITTTYTYDQANRIVEIDSVSSSGSTVEKISYGYDGAGNKTKEEITKEDKHYLREYTYYKNNTVKSMTESGDNDVAYIYQYDAAGNIVEKVVTEDGISKTYSYEYNEANRMTEEKEDGVTRRLYRYDANGNRTEVVISAEEAVAGEAIEETTTTATATEAATETNGKGKGKNKGGAAVEVEAEAVEASKEEVDTYIYDDADRLIEIIVHNGKQFTYGYDGEGNRLWRTYSQTPVIKEGLPIPEPGTDKGKGKENAPGQNKDKDNGNGNGNGNGKKTGAVEDNTLEVASVSLSQIVFAAAEKSNNGNGKDNDNGNDNGNGKDNGKDNDSGNDNDNGNDDGNGKDNGNGNDNGNGKDNGKDKENGNDKDGIDKDSNGKGKDKNLEHKGAGWAKAHEKSKAKGNRGKHLGWYKKLTHPNNPGGIEITEPEVFEVTNYINDINRENAEVLMTSDVDGNYWSAYTYGIDRISAEDLVSIEGRPNNPLYYLQDALGTMTSVTNMNAGIIDSNRFAPYGEPIDPVAKNSRRSNSSFGFTGEAHGIEEGLVYLRARYYEPETMRFLQQDTVLGNTMEPMTRNLYIYGNANPLKYVDPSGHMSYVKQFDDLLSGVWGGVKDNISGIKNAPGMIISLARALMSKQITAKTLVESGLQGMVEDYVYIISNRHVLYPTTTVTDAQVYEMGKHLSGTVVDIALALTGAGAGALAGKVAKMLEKTGGVGKKLVKAFKSGKVDDVLDNVADEGALLAKEAADALANGKSNTPSIKSRANTVKTNAEKGALGEEAADLVMSRAGYNKLPSKVGSNNGFDGVYIKYGRNGEIQDIIINESKFGTSKLSTTVDGFKQMSPDWIDMNIRKMLRSSDADVRATGKLLRDNIDLIKTKMNRLTPNGVNKWSSDPGGWGQ